VSFTGSEHQCGAHTSIRTATISHLICSRGRRLSWPIAGSTIIPEQYFECCSEKLVWLPRSFEANGRPRS
jgi:hypothetical protein